MKTKFLALYMFQVLRRTVSRTRHIGVVDLVTFY